MPQPSLEDLAERLERLEHVLGEAPDPVTGNPGSGIYAGVARVCAWVDAREREHERRRSIRGLVVRGIGVMAAVAGIVTATATLMRW